MEAFPLRSGCVRAVLVLIAVLGLAQRSEAQIVIEESVELGAPSLLDPHTVRLIAPEDGVLRIEYGIMQRSSVEYPATGISLRVFVNGALAVDDPVFNRTWDRTELIRFCQGTPYTEHYYTTTDTLDVDAVVEGDTLDFLFVTDRGDYGDDSLEGEVRTRTDGRYDVDMWSYDTFCQQFADRLTVIAEVAPCDGSNLSPQCSSPVASFIRQDNTVLPADSVLMVSRMRTNINLPPTATFEGPVPTTQGGPIPIPTGLR